MLRENTGLISWVLTDGKAGDELQALSVGEPTIGVRQRASSASMACSKMFMGRAPAMVLPLMKKVGVAMTLRRWPSTTSMST